MANTLSPLQQPDDEVPLHIGVDADIIDLAEMFVTHRREQLAELRATTLSDLETLRRLGHELKGTAASFGFGELAAMGAALEQAALDGNDGDATRQLELMASYLARVSVFAR